MISASCTDARGHAPPRENFEKNVQIWCVLVYIFNRFFIKLLFEVFSLQGRPQDLAGGAAKNFFFQIWVRGHAPPRNFFKMVQFGVYFNQILSLKNFKNYHYLYKNFKNCIFLYKRINILDTRLLWVNYSREEIF